MNDLIYLDYHATTPVDPEVFDAMRPYYTEVFGNPGSRTHAYGWAAQEAVDLARAQVAALIGASPGEVVFTSGATESNNLAIKGASHARGDRGDHVVVAATEHMSVLNSCRRLMRDGFRVTVLPVEPTGLLDLELLDRHVTDRTVLVSVMHANNEIGVIQPLAEIARIAQARGALFHTDAAQSAGKVPLEVVAAGVDLVSLSAHKVYGPKGVGALYVRRRGEAVNLVPQMDGGGQERGDRSGSLNVPAIVGFGAACQLAARNLREESRALASLRDQLQRALCDGLDGIRVNGATVARLPHNLNVSIDGVDGEKLFGALPDIAVSSGSTCSGASRRPSHVLQAIGLPEALCHATLRFGLGRYTTLEDVEQAAARVIGVVRQLRQSPPPVEVPAAELAERR